MTTRYVIESLDGPTQQWCRVNARAWSWEDAAPACEMAQIQANADGDRWRVVRVEEWPICEIHPVPQVSNVVVADPLDVRAD